MNLGGIYKDLGNLDKALESTLKSLELKPDNPNAYMNLGGIYKDLGNFEKALESILKSLELKPDNPNALSNLFGTYGKEEIPKLEYLAHRAIQSNLDILNDLTYIEVISSLGKKRTLEIISKKSSAH